MIICGKICHYSSFNSEHRIECVLTVCHEMILCERRARMRSITYSDGLQLIVQWIIPRCPTVVSGNYHIPYKASQNVTYQVIGMDNVSVDLRDKRLSDTAVTKLC